MPSTNKRSFSWLLQQFQLKPGKPAIFLGLRSLLILGVPIGIGIMTLVEDICRISQRKSIKSPG
ncbi:hypothetical protein LC593_03465 [Nostoc sp. CHAB 5844]|nr:hypothetical protein [Nostoc sp. CHAB 5844]